MRFLPLLGSGLLLLTAAAPLCAQTASSEPIANKAFAARTDHVYLLAGAAMARYGKLNDAVANTPYPSLKTGAFMAGAGYGQNFGRLGVQLEWRWTVRANDLDSSRAYTSMSSNTLALLGSYQLLVTRAYALAVVGGFSYGMLTLALHDPYLKLGAASTVAGQVKLHGNQHRFYQPQAFFTAGLQFNRHFNWARRNDVQACGRARQFTVGARLQYDLLMKAGRWRTEQAFFRKADRLEPDPIVNPLGLSATLVVGGLFNRY